MPDATQEKIFGNIDLLACCLWAVLIMTQELNLDTVSGYKSKLHEKQPR